MGKCVVYLVNADDEIIDEQEYDELDFAIDTHFNKMDSHGNRYHIEVKGHDPPFKRKKKILFDAPSLKQK